MPKNELATRPQTPMDLAQSIVSEGNVDAAQMPAMLRELLTLDREYKADRAREEFAQVVADFQAKCPPVLKAKAAAFGGREAYRYAAYEDVMAAVRPHLNDAGLSISFYTKML